MVCNITDTFFREGIGHGTTTTHFGAKIVHLSTIYKRVVAMEGPLADLTTGAIVVALL